MEIWKCGTKDSHTGHKTSKSLKCSVKNGNLNIYNMQNQPFYAHLWTYKQRNTQLMCNTQSCQKWTLHFCIFGFHRYFSDAFSPTDHNTQMCLCIQVHNLLITHILIQHFATERRTVTEAVVCTDISHAKVTFA